MNQTKYTHSTPYVIFNQLVSKPRHALHKQLEHISKSQNCTRLAHFAVAFNITRHLISYPEQNLQKVEQNQSVKISYSFQKFNNGSESVCLHSKVQQSYLTVCKFQTQPMKCFWMLKKIKFWISFHPRFKNLTQRALTKMQVGM